MVMLMEDNKVLKFVKELIPYVIILILVLVLRTYVFTPIKVNGTSMVPTLDGGEFMILTKYNKNDLNRDDIVIVAIEHNDIKEDLIKRIIALPGETVSCKDGIIYVNSKKREEKYGKGVTNDFEKIKLGQNEYFVLGDNRETSLDSSESVAIKKSQIKGKANFVVFPFDKFGKVK
jgi:signal peptidase I